MCTYATEQRTVTGSGKGPQEWLGVTTATVYFDHPAHAMADHTLNIDFADPGRGPSARVALELTAESALALCEAIVTALGSVPPELSGIDPGRLAPLAST